VENFNTTVAQHENNVYKTSEKEMSSVYGGKQKEMLQM